MGLTPGAESGVIRAAYRALMRLYHPDTNPDPAAQARAREITAAFFVLGNPERRAAYDALHQTGPAVPQRGHPLFFAEQRGPPPMRALGLAAVALAFGLSAAVALWPTRDLPGPPPSNRTVPASTQEMPEAPPERPPQQSEPISVATEGTEGFADPPAPVIAPEVVQPEPPPVRQASAKPIGGTVRRMEAAKAVAPEAPRVAQAPTPDLASCGTGGSGASACKDDRPGQVERLAAGFLQQSLAHASPTKRQLLLSARIRSTTARKLCRSDRCVADVYLRQMRDTTAIMEGRVPSQ